MSSTKNRVGKQQEEVFKELDQEMIKRREQSMPNKDVIEKESLTADNEDKSKSFATKKIERQLSKLAVNYLNDVEMINTIDPVVKVKKGELLVTSRDIRGIEKTHDAINISMDTIKFYCIDTKPTRVVKIKFSVDGTVLEVKNSNAIEVTEEFATFRLVEFGNNTEDWTNWIEKITRINKES